MSRSKVNFREGLRQDLMFCSWTPEELTKIRKDLGLSQKDIAAVLDVTKAAISRIETGRSTSPSIMILYGLIIERYWAYQKGYVPAYRKVGTNHFMEKGDVKNYEPGI